VDQADDTTTILDKYIDGIEVELDKNRLKNILKDIYSEALTIES
jgi:pheromone shutdown protein TraB